MHRYQFRDTASSQVRPNSLEFRAVRKAFVYFDGWIRLGVSAFDDQLPVIQANDGLPFHDTALVQPLRRMLADYITIIGHKASNFVEKPAHPAHLCAEQ